MRYDYMCHDCSTKKNFVFIIEHGMMEKPKVKCPKCGKTNTEKTFTTSAGFYVKGVGYLDVKGRRRDMHLHKLMNDDPYGHMRQPGEKEELAASLRKGGKHNPKGKKFYVTDRAKK